MTVSQLVALRSLHEALFRIERTMTAREMAMVPHDLDRTGNRATTRTGEVWCWDERRGMWGR
jgi:hypothetical protein